MDIPDVGESFAKGTDKAVGALTAAAAAVTFPARSALYSLDQTSLGQFCRKVDTIATFGLYKPRTSKPEPFNFN